jgi:uncharacterized RDD family membrane protein YckC
MQSSHNAEGVYFDREDYAGFWLRVLVDIIDITIMLTVSVSCSLLLMTVVSPPRQVASTLFVLWGGLWFLYFVLLKRTDFGTFGYKLCKVRIVNVRGECPSIAALTLRLMFAVFGPLNTIIDLLWLSGDDNRQALRDKFAQTYVIKRDACPVGDGKLVYSVFDVWGWNLVFREVRRAHDKAFPGKEQ